MSLVLSLETSTPVCSVALHENGKLVALAETRREQSHASKLAVLIEEVFSFSDTSMKNLSAVAVSSGPGSYTGLRIGTSTAKGICYSLGIPLVSIGTLPVLAAQIQRLNIFDGCLCPMIDARRMEVYCEIFDASLKSVRAVEAKVIDAESFIDLLDNQRVLFFGNGASKCKDTIKHPNAVFLDDIHPSAGQLGQMASEKLASGQTENLFLYEPFYMKEFVAKLPANKIL